MSKPRVSYHEILKQDMSALVDELELPDLYKQSMKARWLDQMLWTDKKATQSQKRYFALRLTTVIGGVIIPALVAFNNFGLEEPQAGRQNYFRTIFPIALFGLTQVVAISTAIEEFFQYGLQWRQYRTTAESLKSEGWQYFQLSGAYRKAGSHLMAYPAFSTRVEHIIRRDVQTYLSEIAKEQNKDEEEEDKSVSVSHQLNPLSSGFFAGLGTSTPPLVANDVLAPRPANAGQAMNAPSPTIIEADEPPEMPTQTPPSPAP